MKALFSIILLTLIYSCNSKEETESEHLLKESAIPIKNLTALSSKIYDELSAYDVIMVGEMHGTNEPAEFTLGICRLISEREESVILGLEIPPQKDKYSENMSMEELKDLPFFIGENTSGQNGMSCLQLIAECNKNKKIDLRFIDRQNLSNRDTSMYQAICDIKKVHPKTKIVTLTGNIHNWLKPFHQKERIGGYLIKDTINFEADRIMSINHIFSEGTMLNSMGNGLELTTIEKKDNIFNKTIPAKNYLSKIIFEDQNQNTHFLFTEKVTHSEILGGD